MRILNLSLCLAALSGVCIPATASAADDCPPLTRINAIDTTTGPGGYMLVPIKLGDAERLMLFDTGGSLSSITAATAKELNIPVYESRVKIATVSGAVSDRVAIIPSVTLGTAEQKRVQYMVLPSAMPPGIAGLLAPAPGVDIDLDFAGHKLSFFSTRHCEGKVVYWQAPAVAVVPMRVAGISPNGALSTEHIIIPVNLDGKSVDALIDTGATTNVLKLSLATDRFGVNLSAPDVTETGHLGNNLSDKTYRKQFGTLSFEGVTVTNPEMQLIPDKQSGAFGDQRRIGSLIRPTDTGLPDLIVGMPILSKLHMYVAYAERKVYITAGTTPAGVQNASVSAPAAPALQIGGSWQVASPVVTPACEITQNGGELTGACTQPRAKGELTGVVAGQAIRWQWKATANSNGQVSLWNFSGTMSKDTMITGYVELNGRQLPFFATSLSSSAPTPQVAGSWKIASPIGVPLCNIAQDGDKLTGSCAGPQAEGELTGTVAGQSIRWQWKASANSNGNVALLNFWGAMSTDKTITGYVISNGRSGSFTATKQ